MFCGVCVRRERGMRFRRNMKTHAVSAPAVCAQPDITLGSWHACAFLASPIHCAAAGRRHVFDAPCGPAPDSWTCCYLLASVISPYTDQVALWQFTPTPCNLGFYFFVMVRRTSARNRSVMSESARITIILFPFPSSQPALHLAANHRVLGRWHAMSLRRVDRPRTRAPLYDDV